MTCLAVWAAMRPKSIGGSGSTMNSPTFAIRLARAARCARVIWVASFSTGSRRPPVARQRDSPDLRSMVARMSCSWPYLARPAFWMACSIASSTSSRSIDLLARDGVGDLQQLRATQPRRFRVVSFDRIFVAPAAAGEAAAAVDRRIQLDLGLEAGEAVKSARRTSGRSMPGELTSSV
jgi:hypothetical protein